jgi:hypothetical protein
MSVLGTISLSGLTTTTSDYLLAANVEVTTSLTVDNGATVTLPNNSISDSALSSNVMLLNATQTSTNPKTFQASTVNTVPLMITNTGTAPVTINEVWVNGLKQTTVTYNPSTATAAANSGMTINCTYAWTNGANYQVRLTSSKGNQFPYTAVAPTS